MCNRLSTRIVSLSATILFRTVTGQIVLSCRIILVSCNWIRYISPLIAPLVKVKWWKCVVNLWMPHCMLYMLALPFSTYCSGPPTTASSNRQNWVQYTLHERNLFHFVCIRMRFCVAHAQFFPCVMTRAWFLFSRCYCQFLSACSSYICILIPD